MLILCSLICIAALCNAVMDVLNSRYDKSIFSLLPESLQSWCDPTISWVNKWKNGNPKYGDRFPLSSTMFVFVTDLWHCCKFIMLMCFFISIALHNHLGHPIGELVFIYVLYTCIFQLCYSGLLIKKEYRWENWF
jgi:hypothetical protein